jgi:hypothetical protein
MSTSGSYDNTSTMTEIIYDAFALCNIIDDGETLPADQWEYGKRKLNELMALFSQHRGLWLIDDITVTLVPGTKSYTVGTGLDIAQPKPQRIIDARRVTSGGSEIPIDVVSREEYSSIPNKALQSPTNMVYYDPRRDNGVLYVWPTGTADEDTVILTTQRPIQDFDTEGNNPDLPKEWILCIKYQLATVIAPKYLGGVVPADIKILADQFLSSLILSDEEKTSVFIS